ncbi:MAG: DUF1990 domain-containing protein [Bacteroidota bacterium]
MFVSLRFPNLPRIQQFIQGEEGLPYSYPEIGASRTQGPAHYDNDHHSVYLGEGEAVWNRAVAALRAWQQFPPDWTVVHPQRTPLEEGQTVAVLFRLFGMWWTNSARIVYCLDEPQRFGFAYGTLPGHVECGEECFWIERDSAGAIHYHIRAFSKPRFWLVRLAYPFARTQQKRFVRQSLARMEAIAQQNIKL